VALVIGIILAILYATGVWHNCNVLEVTVGNGNGNVRRGGVSDPRDFVNWDGKLECVLGCVMGVIWALAVGRLARWWG